MYLVHLATSKGCLGLRPRLGTFLVLLRFDYNSIDVAMTIRPFPLSLQYSIQVSEHSIECDKKQAGREGWHRYEYKYQLLKWRLQIMTGFH